MSAKDILLYSYQAGKVDFINQSLITMIDSIIGHVENMSCLCESESIAYNVFFIKTSDWPSDKRMVIGVYVDEMQNYLWKEWRYVSYFDRKGKIYNRLVQISSLVAIYASAFLPIDVVKSCKIKKSKKIGIQICVCRFFVVPLHRLFNSAPK